jgi:NADH-ubiquinone oxidoreductase chain 2
MSSVLILLSSAVTFRRDKAISFNRITMIVLLYSSILGYETLFLLPLHSGIGIYGGLYQVSSLTQTFLIFISILSIIILQLSSFYYRHLEHKGNIFDPASDSNEHSSFILKREIKQADSIYGNKNHNKISDLLEEEIKIIEYPLVILFILIGAMCLMSSSDLISMFLSIELQSYGLYILATMFKDSEYATSAGLTYFLLGGLSSCFILLGSSLLYVNTGLTYLDGIYILYNLMDTSLLNYNSTGFGLIEENIYNTQEINSPIQSLNISLVILSVGYLFKVSSAPFHF